MISSLLFTFTVVPKGFQGKGICTHPGIYSHPGPIRQPYTHKMLFMVVHSSYRYKRHGTEEIIQELWCTYFSAQRFRLHSVFCVFFIAGLSWFWFLHDLKVCLPPLCGEYANESYHQLVATSFQQSSLSLVIFHRTVLRQ